MATDTYSPTVMCSPDCRSNGAIFFTSLLKFFSIMSYMAPIDFRATCLYVLPNIRLAILPQPVNFFQDLFGVPVVRFQDLADILVVPDVVVLHPLKGVFAPVDFFPDAFFRHAFVLADLVQNVAPVTRKLIVIAGRR